MKTLESKMIDIIIECIEGTLTPSQGVSKILDVIYPELNKRKENCESAHELSNKLIHLLQETNDIYLTCDCLTHITYGEKFVDNEI